MTALATELKNGAAMPEVVSPSADAQILVDGATDIAACGAALDKAANAGFSAICHAAALFYTFVTFKGAKADALQAALVAGTKLVSEKTATRYMKDARRIATHWTTTGLPAGFLAYIQTPGATLAGSVPLIETWFGLQGVKSIEDCEGLFKASRATPSAPKGKGESIAKAIVKAGEAGELTLGVDVLAIFTGLLTVASKSDLETMAARIASALALLAAPVTVPVPVSDAEKVAAELVAKAAHAARQTAAEKATAKLAA